MRDALIVPSLQTVSSHVRFLDVSNLEHSLGKAEASDVTGYVDLDAVPVKLVGDDGRVGRGR